MKYAFLVSGIIEILGAIAMYFKPDLLFDISFIGISKIYALAAFALGLVNVFAYLHYESSAFFKKLFLLMFGFHGALAMVCYGMSDTMMNLKIEATFTHLACFVIFFVSYMKNVGSPIKP